MTTDAKLADTQRAIIESAERRGYERALAEQRAGVREQPAQCGEEIMVNADGNDVYILPLQPSGLKSGPRFVVHVPAPQAAPVVPPGWKLVPDLLAAAPGAPAAKQGESDG